MASEFLIVARQVLEKEGRPLRPQDIVSIGIRDGLFSDKRAGKTPAQTMKSKLSVDIRRKGETSDFVRTAPGLFYLRSLLAPDSTTFTSRPTKKPPAKESVLVIPSTWFPEDLRFQGIRESYSSVYKRLLQPHVCRHIPRLEAESTESFKQVLTYILVTRGNSVLAYKRGNYNRVEDYLRGAHCVGFGGHVTSKDRTLFTTEGMGIWEAAARELSEELNLPRQDTLQLQRGSGLSLLGVLNDDSSPTGRKHIAFVFKYETAEDANWSIPARGEKAITQVRWLSPESVLTPIWEFEYWSQLCLRHFFPSVVRAAPAFRLMRRNAIRKRHVLCVVGCVGSGKSEATALLRDEYGYRELNSGKAVARLIGLPPVPVTPREVFQERAWQFINAPDGPELLAAELARMANKHPNDLLLVDGIRQRTTLEALRAAVTDRKIVVLFVETPTDLAFELFKKRERQTATFSQFNSIRLAQVEEDSRGLIRDADAILYNWMGLQSYQRTIRKMITLWRGE